MKSHRGYGHIAQRDVNKSLAGLAVELAYALRLAVTTEFPKERSAALEAWEEFVIKSDRKQGWP